VGSPARVLTAIATAQARRGSARRARGGGGGWRHRRGGLV